MKLQQKEVRNFYIQQKNNKNQNNKTVPIQCVFHVNIHDKHLEQCFKH